MVAIMYSVLVYLVQRIISKPTKKTHKIIPLISYRLPYLGKKKLHIIAKFEVVFQDEVVFTSEWIQ
jgi:hypothetical protein